MKTFLNNLFTGIIVVIIASVFLGFFIFIFSYVPWAVVLIGVVAFAYFVGTLFNAKNDDDYDPWKDDML